MGAPEQRLSPLPGRTFFDNFIDLYWFYWLQYIATVLDQELLDYLQQIIQGIPITIHFSVAISCNI